MTITIEELSVRYGAITALDEITLQVPAGEFVLLTGPSGCGKSTLARALAGLIPHAMAATMSGRVIVNGLDTRQSDVATLAQQVGTVSQNPADQLFHLRLADEVAFGPRNLGLAETAVQERVNWALQVTGISHLQGKRPSHLSGGQQQLAAIAAALAMQPQILLLDEPTASLDGPGTQTVLDALHVLHARHGITVILIEHRLPPHLEKIDRAILMENGRIVADGEPRYLLSDATWQKQLGLRPPRERPLPSWRMLREAKRAVSDRLANGRSGNGYSANGCSPLLRFQEVWAGHGAEPVLQDVSFSLKAGEFAALVGANGAGKSTLALTAAGLLKPTKGEVIFCGGQQPRPGRDVALLFQNPAEQLFTDSVEEEVAFGPQNYGVFQPDFHRATLAAADLQALRRRHPTHLSQGQQQRTAVAACAAMQPRLLILDEPTMGQDWFHLQQVMDFAAALQAQGTAILLISHDYDLVNRYAKRILLIEAGQIKE